MWKRVTLARASKAIRVNPLSAQERSPSDAQEGRSGWLKTQTSGARHLRRIFSTTVSKRQGFPRPRGPGVPDLSGPWRPFQTTELCFARAVLLLIGKRILIKANIFIDTYTYEKQVKLTDANIPSIDARIFQKNHALLKCCVVGV